MLRNQVQSKVELIAEYDPMKAELAALRNYVYHLEIDEFEHSSEKDFVSQLKKLQFEHKIAIIGGTTKWRHSIKDFNFDQVRNCDMYFIYTKVVKHAAYDKLISNLGSQKKWVISIFRI